MLNLQQLSKEDCDDHNHIKDLNHYRSDKECV